VRFPTISRLISSVTRSARILDQYFKAMNTDYSSIYVAAWRLTWTNLTEKSFAVDGRRNRMKNSTKSFVVSGGAIAVAFERGNIGMVVDDGPGIT
jgi:hypothetical protein